MYHSGTGVAANSSEALTWCRKAADQGLDIAQYWLGGYYRWEGSEDVYEALKWLRRAAEQGHAYAQLDLGAMYDEGDGVTQDYSEAAKWYQMAALQGIPAPQNRLSEMYRQGLGVTQNNEEAYFWLLLASDTMWVADELHELAQKLTVEQRARAWNRAKELRQ